MKPLEASTLAKTAHGILPRFADIFAGARYAPVLYSDKKRGTAYAYAPPEVFLSTLGARGMLPSATPQGAVLVATPVLDLGTFLPRIGDPANLALASTIEVIAWEPHGHFLIVAKGPSGIESKWIGFVPMTERFEVVS